MIQVIGGIAAGAAAMILAPSLMSAIAPVFKPITKTLIKGGLLAFEAGKQVFQESRSALASAVESIEDLSAEARAELVESQKEPAKTRKK